MQPQNQNSNQERPNGRPEPPTQRIIPRTKTLTLQPSDAFVQEMAAAKASAPVPAPLPTPPQPATAAEPVAVTTPTTQPPAQPVTPVRPAASSIYPDPDKPVSPITIPQPTGDGKDYDPSHSRVCKRASGLEVFAYVLLVLTVTESVVLWGIALHSVLFLLGPVLYISLAVGIVVPIISAILFLVSKNVALVKALLIVLVLNYVYSIVDTAVSSFSASSDGESVGIGTILSVLVSIGFGLWAWSLFGAVNLLDA